MVLSSACMRVATMAQIVTIVRFADAPSADDGKATAIADHQMSAIDRLWPVSMVTSALMPARSGGSVGLRSRMMRTGMRCTTLTQLPLAFWAGRIENSAPLAGAMVATFPDQVLPG